MKPPIQKHMTNFRIPSPTEEEICTLFKDLKTCQEYKPIPGEQWEHNHILRKKKAKRKALVEKSLRRKGLIPIK